MESSRLLVVQRVWLVTGVAGFIGSNLLEALLLGDQIVIGLDNFSTGYGDNLHQVQRSVGESKWKNFSFYEGDLCDLELCHTVCNGVDHILHQAALGSVPRSISDPISTNRANVSGFLNLIVAAKEAGVKSFTYASSSSIYGDLEMLPKVEGHIGRALSPYAVSKYVNELYGEVFASNYGLKTIGLRYFNVFGKRQDPNGAYAAVIPRWISAMLRGSEVFINGDGNTSRDFCFVENVVQANLLSALAGDRIIMSDVFNVAVGGRTTLNELFSMLKSSLSDYGYQYENSPIYKEFREGDVRHSQADISKAISLLGYLPSIDVREGISRTMPWYIEKIG